MQGVRDVIGQIHHGALQGLPAWWKVWKCAESVEHLRQINDVGRELGCAVAARMPGAAWRNGPVGGMWIRIVEQAQGILQYRRTSGRSEVKTLVARAERL